MVFGRLGSFYVVSLFALLLFALPAEGQPIPLFEFTTNNDTITITRATLNDEFLTIPDFINGLPVTSFKDWAFAFSTAMDIKIPSSFTNMGNMTFLYCNYLTNVNIPKNIGDLGARVFEGCASLTSITIGNRVTHIGVRAFSDCANLEKVYFQGNAPNLDLDVFAGDNKATIYYMPGTLGWDTTFGGRPTVLWNPQAITSHANFGVRTNQFGFPITGSTNLVIVVEVCTNLLNPVWTSVSTNTLTDGSSYFSDPQWTNYSRRFYRFRSP